MLIEGEVVARPENGRNAELATGDVEVKASSMRVVGPADTPAIPVTLGKGETLPSEELRLRHRYLDLRRPDLQTNIVLRHRLMQATRRHLSDRGFLEIETPILTKPTPEGARDYLVPSRVSAGEFYALPQSPQLYKQLLMIAGFDRYFQIARCFRDEDLRADRQPEFTQIDIEASFISAEDIYTLAEGLLAALWKEAGVAIPTPFPRMKYATPSSATAPIGPICGTDSSSSMRPRFFAESTSASRGARSRVADACAECAFLAERRSRASRWMSSRHSRRARVPRECSGSSARTVSSPARRQSSFRRSRALRSVFPRASCACSWPLAITCPRRRSIASDRKPQE